MKKVNILFSCPNDFYLSFKDEVYNTFNEINEYTEKLLDMRFDLHHYLTSSYSQVGKPAQDHLDDTLLLNCDVCYAFFFHKLGTKTTNYKSGTDEEINLMKQRGKHVSLFWIQETNNDNNDQNLVDYFNDITQNSYYLKIIGKDNIKKILKNDILNFISKDFAVTLNKICKGLF